MSEGARVLIIDDELQIRRIVRLTLTANGFAVIEAATGREGIYKAAADRPDVVLLDLGLPDMDGQAVLTGIREWSAMPIVILSVRDEEGGKVAALEAGADDYITKPFSVKELVARVRVALRHARAPADEVREFRNGGLFVDLVNHIVTSGGREVRLTATEYSLLTLFVKNPGKLLTHNHIIKELWGPFAAGGIQRLRVHMAQMRKKLEPGVAASSLIVTEPGVGYRLAASEEEAP